MRLDRQSKREGLQMSSRPETRGHKRGVMIEVDDAEKAQNGKAMENESWTTKLWRNDWKK